MPTPALTESGRVARERDSCTWPTSPLGLGWDAGSFYRGRCSEELRAMRANSDTPLLNQAAACAHAVRRVVLKRGFLVPELSARHGNPAFRTTSPAALCLSMTQLCTATMRPGPSLK